MTTRKSALQSALRGALCTVSLAATLSACTRTEVTELNCVRVADDHLSIPRERSADTVVCSPQRVRLVYRDKYYEPEVVSDETW